MKSRAAVFRQAHKPLSIETIDVRSPGPHEVLVEFKATGLCHTDLSVLDGVLAWPAPTVLGHEGAGVVIETGPGVSYVVPGDHVIGHSMPQCGHCPHCASEKTNICEELLNGNIMQRSGFSANGQPIGAYMGLGSFANYAVLHEDQIARVNSEAPLEKVCTIGCALVTGVGSVFHSAEVEVGSTVLVIGLGAIGLSVIQGARLAGADRIIAMDTNDAKESVARRLGATDYINPKQINGEISKYISELTGGGVRYVFECVGTTAVMELALSCTRPGLGVCCLVGMAPSGAVMKVDPQLLVLGRRLISNAAGNTKVRRDVPKIVDWYLEGKILLDPLISHVMPFDRLNDGCQMMRDGQVIRPVFLY